MRESSLVNSIVKYCKRERIYCRKIYGGGAIGRRGLPDLILCIDGKFVGLECKVGGNEPTELQHAELCEIISSGGIAETVRTIDEFKRVVSLCRHKSAAGVEIVPQRT